MLQTNPQTLRTGTILNERFIILDYIGSGDLGSVYKAQDKSDNVQENNRYIALKVLNDDIKNCIPLLTTIAEQIKKTQSQVHQYISPYIDFFQNSDIAFLTMELLESSSLDTIIEQNPFGLDPIEAINIINQIGNALSYSHKKHIYHPDLQTSNIFYDQSKQIKILGFSLTPLIRASLEEINHQPPAFNIDIPSHFSMEMLNEAPPCASDDMYAFGCICYKLLTGKHPYENKTADIAYQQKLVPEKIKSLSHKQWNTLNKTLALKKKDRLNSMDVFLKAFNQKGVTLNPYLISTIIIAPIIAIAYVNFKPIATQIFSEISSIKILPVTDNKDIKYIPTAQQPEKLVLPDKVKLKTETETETKIPAIAAVIPKAQHKEISNPEIQSLVDQVSPINIWAENENYLIGSTLQVNLNVTEELYVRVFLINSAGESIQLLPNPFQPNNLLKPGVKFQIPPKDAEFTLDIGPPIGKDRIIAFSSPAPIPENIIQFDNNGMLIDKQEIQSYYKTETSYRIQPD